MVATQSHSAAAHHRPKKKEYRAPSGGHNKVQKVHSTRFAVPHLLVGAGCPHPRGGEPVEAGLVHVACDDVLRLGHLRRAPTSVPRTESQDRIIRQDKRSTRVGCSPAINVSDHSTTSATLLRVAATKKKADVFCRPSRRTLAAMIPLIMALDIIPAPMKPSLGLLVAMVQTWK